MAHTIHLATCQGALDALLRDVVREHPISTSEIFDELLDATPASVQTQVFAGMLAVAIERLAAAQVSQIESPPRIPPIDVAGTDGVRVE